MAKIHGRLGFFSIDLDPEFPLGDIEFIAKFLLSSNCLIPGYIPSPRGLLDIIGIYYLQEVEKFKLFVLPDRNIISSLTSVARKGLGPGVDQPTRIAVNLMAFCQCMNIHIEPSIAFHEVASHVPNSQALIELGWFRAADKANPIAWVDLAMDRSKKPISQKPEHVDAVDLTFPLHRWKRNYIAALKIAELELDKNLNPRDRMENFLDWMINEFIVAGPAALVASVYFAPRSHRGGMFKGLRSENKEKVLHGIRNEAWDITHLSDFVKRVANENQREKRYIFASADKKLVTIASSLMIRESRLLEIKIDQYLFHFWPQKDAVLIAKNLSKVILEERQRERPIFDGRQIEELISLGEQAVLSK
jgi:hypothetical protein